MTKPSRPPINDRFVMTEGSRRLDSRRAVALALVSLVLLATFVVFVVEDYTLRNLFAAQ